MAKLSNTLVKSLHSLNGYLQSPVATKECRRGICESIERILFDHSAYKGYRYLSEFDLRDVATNKMPDGMEPGVRFEGPELTATICDEYRRHYTLQDVK